MQTFGSILIFEKKNYKKNSFEKIKRGSNTEYFLLNSNKQQSYTRWFQNEGGEIEIIGQ